MSTRTEAPAFQIRRNNATVKEPCAVCGMEHRPELLGVALFVGESGETVCRTCGNEHAPELQALVDERIRQDRAIRAKLMSGFCIAKNNAPEHVPCGMCGGERGWSSWVVWQNGAPLCDDCATKHRPPLAHFAKEISADYDGRCAFYGSEAEEVD